MANEYQIDTEMYLRDGMPFANVCKVQLKDGRIGIGIFRQDPKAPGALEDAAADRAALDDALENVPNAPVTMTATRQHHEHVDYIHDAGEEPDHDLQASLGQPAR